MAYRVGTTYNVPLTLDSLWASEVEFRAVITENIDVAANKSKFSVQLQYKGNIQTLSSDAFSKFYYGINKNSYDFTEQTFLPSDYSNSASWATIATPTIDALNESFVHRANGSGTYWLSVYVYTRGRFLGFVRNETSSTNAIEHDFTTIDRTVPTVSATSSNITTAGTATITATASHSTYGISLIEVTINGQTYASNMTPQNPRMFTANITGLTSGRSYSYRVRATCENLFQSSAFESLAVPQGVTGVDISQTTINMVVGNQSTLTYVVSPSNAVNRAVSFNSSNPNVATVNSSGVVSAVGAGNTTITITTADGSLTDTCAVTVAAAPIAVSSVDISTGSLRLKIGESRTVSAVVYPNNASNKTISWASSNASLVSVKKTSDYSALIEAVSLNGTTGTATITVTTADGNKTDTLTVTVYAENTVYSETSRLTGEMLCGFFNNCAYLKQVLSAKGISVSLNSPIGNLKGRNTSPLDISYACTRTENNCRAIKTALSSVTDTAALTTRYTWSGKNRTWHKGVNDWIAFFSELSAIINDSEPLKDMLIDCNGEDIKVYDGQRNSVNLFISKNTQWSDL